MNQNKLLALPDDGRVIAFRSIEEVLREDGTLDRVVANWLTREGRPGEMKPVTAAMCPVIALSPVPEPNKVIAIDTNQINFVVSVQLFVRGTCVDDLINLWGAVERAVRHDAPIRGTTVQRFLCDRRVLGLKSLQPAFYPVQPGDPNSSDLVQDGLGTLRCFFDAPA